MTYVAWLGAALALVLLADQRESPVGLPARIEQLVLPGSELVAAPADAKSPIVLRITGTYPHGTAFRYDLEYFGLDPGEFDLRDSLRRRDASATSDLPPIRVTVRSQLPPGQVRPHPPTHGPIPTLGGYRMWWILGGIVWVGGLVAYWLAFRRRRAAAHAAARPLTLADRLKPLVEGALQGTLSQSALAELELALVAYWRRRLGLDDRRPDEVLTTLRDHAEAGPLIRSVEDWLHRPAAEAQVDLNALLAPYAFLPPDALEDGEGGLPPLPSARRQNRVRTEPRWTS